VNTAHCGQEAMDAWRYLVRQAGAKETT
jgi:hypothetical protein